MDAPCDLLIQQTAARLGWRTLRSAYHVFHPDNYVLALKLDPNGRMFVQYFKMDDLGKEAGGSETYCAMDENGTEERRSGTKVTRG